MRGAGRCMIALVVAVGFSVGAAPVVHAADSHTSHTDGHTSGGGGKGPKFMGGDRGSGHSSQTHKGGSHHHDGGSGGSKSVEHKIFSSDIGHAGGVPAGGTDHHDSGVEHAH